MSHSLETIFFFFKNDLLYNEQGTRVCEPRTCGRGRDLYGVLCGADDIKNLFPFQPL